MVRNTDWSDLNTDSTDLGCIWCGYDVGRECSTSVSVEITFQTVADCEAQARQTLLENLGAAEEQLGRF